MSRFIEIPDAAVVAADIWSGQIPRTDLLDALEGAAPHIIAAELRDLVQEMKSRPANQPLTVDDIEGRITQLLDPA